MEQSKWLEKPYYSLDAYCKNTFHHKCYKIALNAHMTCPNRDGTLDTRGCIFCSRGGSGEYSIPIESQLEAGLALFGNKNVGDHFIAYFQAYTNTYAPVSYLETVYRTALMHPKVCGISIATRPDCMGSEVMELLCSLQAEFREKFIWVELGLQTIHDASARYIRRCYPLSVFETAFQDLTAAGIPVIVHVILGLPGESREMQLETIDYLSSLHPFGVKLQLLHILRDTDLAEEYYRGRLSVMELEEYLSLLSDCIARLSPDIVIHRLTGDGAGKDLIAPDWSRNKKNVLNRLHHRLRTEHIRQGMNWKGTAGE